ncbi:MAG TPA: hypothetical protein VK806_04565 [Bacteroidia bacterium]|jgi:hypothetical protein|nr:hypothetical protein [Bacteroidia bacterium]
MSYKLLKNKLSRIEIPPLLGGGREGVTTGSVLFFLASIFLFSCTQSSMDDGKVRVVNKLGKNTVCILGYNYPDLSFGFVSKQDIISKMNQFEVDTNQNKEIDTLGLCKKEVWDSKIKHSMLMLFVFDKDKLAGADKLEDALLERYYFSYQQLQHAKGIITLSN